MTIVGAYGPDGARSRAPGHDQPRGSAEDIVTLYDLVAPGTPVSIVDQRVKAGWPGDELYLEVHPNPGVPADQARPNMTDAVRAVTGATSEAVEPPPVDWKM